MAWDQWPSSLRCIIFGRVLGNLPRIVVTVVGSPAGKEIDNPSFHIVMIHLLLSSCFQVKVALLFSYGESWAPKGSTHFLSELRQGLLFENPCFLVGSESSLTFCNELISCAC